MDYIYGQLNERVSVKPYSGVETETTITEVNNSAGTIAVQSKITEQTIDNKINLLNYEDEEQDNLVVTSVSENNGIISVTKKEMSAGSTGYDLLLDITDGVLTLRGSSFEELKEKLTVKYIPLIFITQGTGSGAYEFSMFTEAIFMSIPGTADVITWKSSSTGDIVLGWNGEALIFVFNSAEYTATYNATTKEYTLTTNATH